jgi:hypothetical protein
MALNTPRPDVAAQGSADSPHAALIAKWRELRRPHISRSSELLEAHIHAGDALADALEKMPAFTEEDCTVIRAEAQFHRVLADIPNGVPELEHRIAANIDAVADKIAATLTGAT